MSDSEPHFSTNSPDPSAPGGASEGDSDPGLLVVISGPSGVGKTTIVEDLAERWPFHFSVSATTRPARPDEADGVDYYFVDRDMFRAMIDTGQFLEWAEYADNLYGTPRQPVHDAIDAGRNVLLDIEVNGAVQVMEAHPETVTLFVMPPSLEQLEDRLRGRQDTDERAIAGRMAVAEMQIAVGRDRFAHQVVNHDVEAAIAQIVRILEGRESPDDASTEV